MQYGKVTKLTLRADMPTSVSSPQYGANLNALGFNMDFIATRRPSLAVEIMKLFEAAHEIKESDPGTLEQEVRATSLSERA